MKIKNINCLRCDSEYFTVRLEIKNDARNRLVLTCYHCKNELPFVTGNKK